MLALASGFFAPLRRIVAPGIGAVSPLPVPRPPAAEQPLARLFGEADSARAVEERAGRKHREAASLTGLLCCSFAGIAIGRFGALLQGRLTSRQRPVVWVVLSSGL